MPTVGTFPTSRQDIAGISIADLAAQFSTPTFVYDAAVIVERIEDLKAFDLVRYAQKACSNIAILDFFYNNFYIFLVKFKIYFFIFIFF